MSWGMSWPMTLLAVVSAAGSLSGASGLPGAVELGAGDGLGAGEGGVGVGAAAAGLVEAEAVGGLGRDVGVGAGGLPGGGEEAGEVDAVSGAGVAVVEGDAGAVVLGRVVGAASLPVPETGGLVSS